MAWVTPDTPFRATLAEAVKKRDAIEATLERLAARLLDEDIGYANVARNGVSGEIGRAHV